MLAPNSTTPATPLRFLFRIGVWLHAVLVAAQVISAGALMSGERLGAAAHHHGAHAAVIVCFLVTVIAWLLRRSGQATSQIVLVSGALVVLEVAQTALGYNRIMALHVPLGVAIVIANTRLFALVFPRGERAPRPANSASVAAGGRA